MKKNELLAKYKQNYTREEFFQENVDFAFSEMQLQEAMEKLGAKSKDELTSIFGCGDVCLKENVEKILHWVHQKEKEKEDWLKSLTKEEQERIIKYELYNYECISTGEIDQVIELFENVFTCEQILQVFHRMWQ